MEFRKQTLAVLFGIAFLTISGCAAQNATQGTDLASLKTPTKQVLVTDGDLNKPYDILGEVDCTLDGKSVYAQTDKKEINVALNKVAFSKYGNKVDAIINTTTVTGTNGGFFGALAGGYGAPTGSVSAHGVAVHFK